MRKFYFVPNTKIRIDGIAYELIDPFEVDGVEYWRIKLRATGVYEQKSSAELRAMYDEGLLTGETGLDTAAANQLERKRSRLTISDLPENDRKRIAFRQAILRGVAAQTFSGCKVVPAKGPNALPGETHLVMVLRELGHKHGLELYGKPKTVSTATYYRWVNKYDQHGDNRDLRGDYGNGRGRNPAGELVRKIAKAAIAQLLQDAQQRPLGSKPRYTFRSLVNAVRASIENENLSRPNAPLSCPSKSTLYAYHRQFPASLRELAAHGPIKARAMARTPPIADAEPLAPLDFVQFDETRLPLMVIHEILGIALGRPWLAWLVDVFTGGIVGVYLRFEPPGDLVIASVLRHACIFKSYIKNEYPDIKNDWIISGLPRFITFDNSLQAHGNTTDAICDDLDIFWDYQPPRMPWLKSEVEGAFEIANRLLLKELPGSVPNLGDGPHTKDYDPREHALIGLRQLLWILHHFIVDNLHERVPQGGRRMSTNQLWREGIKMAPPGYIDRSVDLDVLFGIVRTGRCLDHRGVYFEGIYYYGEGADFIRKQLGSRTKVTIKVNPTSLLKIYVRDEKNGGWFPLFAHPKDRTYAARVSLYTHRLYQAHSRRLAARDDVEACLGAERDLQRLIKNVPQDALSIRNLSIMARAMGLGTHNIFNQLGHDGNIEMLTGPYAGMQVNPLIPPATVAASATADPNSSIQHTEKARRRGILPVFRTDNSLLRRT